MKKKMIEIFPDKPGGKYGEYINNIIWTDGATAREMESKIVPTLFWGNKQRDRLWVSVEGEE